MIYIVYAIHVLVCLFLILVVLLQQGSGADLSVFGGGGTQTAFGARSATSLLHKLTVAGFVCFVLTTIAIGFLKTGSTSVMTDVDKAAPAAAVGEATDEATVPATSSETVAPEAASEPASGAEDAAGADGSGSTGDEDAEDDGAGGT